MKKINYIFSQTYFKLKKKKICGRLTCDLLGKRKCRDKKAVKTEEKIVQPIYTKTGIYQTMPRNVGTPKYQTSSPQVLSYDS